MERNTRQRQAVLDALARSGQTLSPPEILLHAKVQVPRLNLSTVYRQIKALQDQSQIVKVELPGHPARFEALCEGAGSGVRGRASRAGRVAALDAGPAADHPQQQDHHHHHFHCTRCERVFPIHACPGPMSDLAPPGFQVQRHDLTLHGLCAGCAGPAKRAGR